MSMPRVICALALSMLAACQQASSETSAPAAAPVATAPTDVAGAPGTADGAGASPPGQSATPPPNPARERIAGWVTGSKAAPRITLCGATTSQPVSFVADARRFVDQFLKNGASEWSVDGWREPGAGNSTRFVAIERADIAPDCATASLTDAVFLAHAKEPPFDARITHAGITIERGGRTTLTAPYATPTRTPGHGWQYTGDGFVLTIEPGFCHGNMSEASFAWSATLKAADESSAGCAYAGLAAP
jgi:uncharacterized membrane protein